MLFLNIILIANKTFSFKDFLKNWRNNKIYLGYGKSTIIFLACFFFRKSLNKFFELENMQVATKSNFFQFFLGNLKMFDQKKPLFLRLFEKFKNVQLKTKVCKYLLTFCLRLRNLTIAP